jgi:hypothetical protein
MSEPHWVWATDANTKQRIPINLSAIPCMLSVVQANGTQVTALFLGGMTLDAKGVALYAQAQVMETAAELFSSPAIKMRSSKAKLPPEIAKLATPHKPAVAKPGKAA